MQGSIELANAVFPPNVYGRDLDVKARDYLWKAGLDYGHGTGFQLKIFNYYSFFIFDRCLDFKVYIINIFLIGMESVIICQFTKVFNYFFFGCFKVNCEKDKIYKINKFLFYLYYNFKAPPNIAYNSGGTDGEYLARGMVSSDG